MKALIWGNLCWVFQFHLGFSVITFCTKYFNFSYFVQISCPLSVTFPKLSNVMSSLTFDRIATRQLLVPIMCSMNSIKLSNWQTLLLIVIPILSSHTTYKNWLKWLASLCHYPFVDLLFLFSVYMIPDWPDQCRCRLAMRSNSFCPWTSQLCNLSKNRQ